MNSKKVNEQQSTLNKRYFYKLSSNFVTILAGIFTSAIVPKALGVTAFGEFSFTNNVITQILSFLDMRASTCFYVKLSQRQNESRIITFYGIYTILVFIILFTIVGLLLIPSSRQLLFEGIDRRVVVFSVLFVTVKWIADIFVKISDAYGSTVVVERIKIINQFLGVSVLVLLFYFDVINIHIFYVHQILMFSLLTILIYSFFRKRNYKVPLIAKLEPAVFKKYASEFYVYSAPLAFYLTTTLITEVFDRYILQHFGGSYEQGLYGFSFSMSNMTILFVTAMMPLFTRELSIAFAENDRSLATSLYRKYVPILYIISAYFCCFLFVNAQSIIIIFGGLQYREALVPLKLMLLYPLISTYSNLNSSVIYAKSSTSFIKKITMIVSPIGMITAYILISSSFLDLGATGLAIKVVAIEYVATIVMFFYISRYLDIKIHKYLLHMMLSPLVLLLTAFGINYLMFYSFNSDPANIFLFLLSGMVYTVIIGIIVYFFPMFMGLSKEQIQTMIGRLKRLRIPNGR